VTERVVGGCDGHGFARVLCLGISDAVDYIGRVVEYDLLRIDGSFELDNIVVVPAGGKKVRRGYNGRRICGAVGCSVID
jgi:hypothetical protein